MWVKWGDKKLRLKKTKRAGLQVKEGDMLLSVVPSRGRYLAFVFYNPDDETYKHIAESRGTTISAAVKNVRKEMVTKFEIVEKMLGYVAEK